MAGKWWEAAPVVGTEQQPTGGGVILSDPYQERGDQRDQTRTDIAVESSQRDARVEGRTIAKDARQGVADLRKEFSALPEVKKYGTIVQQVDTILHTEPTAAGDQDLLYAIAQLRDPLGSVREGDADLIAGGQSFIQQQTAQLGKQLNGQGMFTPEYRNQLRREAISRLNTSNRAYSALRNQFAEAARAANYDPRQVIGPHAGDAYFDRFKRYDEQHGIGSQGQRKPGEGFLPGATPDNVAFDTDTGTGAFGSEIKSERLSPEDEAFVQSYLQSRMGDSRFSGADEVNAILRARGANGNITLDPETVQAIREGKPFGQGVDYSAADEAKRRAALEASYLEIPEGGDVSAAGRDKGLLLNMTDELRGGVGGIKSLLSGDGFMSGYERERDIERALQERSRQENGIAPELIGGLMTPAGVISRANMARDAAAMGAIAGFGEGEGLSDSAAKALTGAGLGYAGGKVVEKVAPAIAESTLAKKASEYFGEGRAQKAQDFTEAAKRQELDYMLADVPGTYKAKMATGLTGMTLGGVPLKDAASKIVEKAKAAKDRIAGNVGNAGDNAATGQAAQKGMEAWERQTEGRGSQLFDAIPIKGDSPVDLATTKQTLSEINGELSSNAELAALVRDPKLVAYQKALDSGGLSWDDTKAFRTRIGKIIGKPSLTSDGASDDAMRALYASLSQDIEKAAAAHSPEAAKAFSRANSYWRGRQGRIDDVMSKLVGKDRNLSAEQTTAQLERWAQVKGGDFNKLYRAVRSLPEDEANNVRAYFIDRMGMAKAGGQDAAAEVFSPETWLTNWNSLSPRAKAILFQGEHRKALDDLATVFSGMKASKTFANPSGTGYSVWGATNAAMATANPLAFALSSVGQIGSGALLGSPRFARWMVALSKKPNPAAQLAHINQLTAIARAEPIIANDIFTLQQRLGEAFAQPQSLRAAAEENDKVGDQKIREGERNGPQ